MITALCIAVGVLAVGFFALLFIVFCLISMNRDHTSAIHDINTTNLLQSDRLQMHQSRLDFQRESLDGQRALVLDLKGSVRALEEQVGLCTCDKTSWRHDDPEPMPDADCPIHGM